MKILKQLDKLVLKSFIGPYIVAFLVAEFVLVLQFLWKYIDEFIGRGISLWIIVKMIFYYGITIIPLAVPISILISSVMVYGGMSERHELTSFKSAGVSLNRLILPGFIIALLTALLSLLSSNVLKPKANLYFYQTFDNVRRAKPTLTIDEGVFNHDFKSFAIRVGKKAPDGKHISDIIIYDQRDRNSLNITTAKRGEMDISGDGTTFNMRLEDGSQYSEVARKSKDGKKSPYQFVRVEFESWFKSFDMSEFSFSLSNANVGRRKHDLFNSAQMIEAIDSLDVENERLKDMAHSNLSYIMNIVELKLPEDEETEELKYKDGLPILGIDNLNTKSGDKYYSNRTNLRLPQDSLKVDTMTSFKSTLRESSYKSILFRTKSQIQAAREKYRGLVSKVKANDYSKNRFILRLHQQFSWALVCIVFMFIGAPLGSIVRKGGFGYPLLIAIAFFIIFIFSSILGEKLMLSGSLHPIIAAWLPIIILLPFAVFFMVKAINDSRLSFKLNIIGWFKK